MAIDPSSKEAKECWDAFKRDFRAKVIDKVPYPKVMTPCEERGWHSFRPDTEDNWACDICEQVANRDPNQPCTSRSLFLPAEHRWYGHDAKGLLCEATAEYNTAKRVHCSCGSSKAWKVRVEPESPDAQAQS